MPEATLVRVTLVALAVQAVACVVIVVNLCRIVYWTRRAKRAEDAVRWLSQRDYD